MSPSGCAGWYVAHRSRSEANVTVDVDNGRVGGQHASGPTGPRRSPSRGGKAEGHVQGCAFRGAPAREHRDRTRKFDRGGAAAGRRSERGRRVIVASVALATALGPLSLPSAAMAPQALRAADGPREQSLEGSPPTAADIARILPVARDPWRGTWMECTFASPTSPATTWPRPSAAPSRSTRRRPATGGSSTAHPPTRASSRPARPSSRRLRPAGPPPAGWISSRC